MSVQSGVKKRRDSNSAIAIHFSGGSSDVVGIGDCVMCWVLHAAITKERKMIRRRIMAHLDCCLPK